MKTTDCLVILEYVPESINRNTNGDIAEGEFLTQDAIACLLNGEMFSGLYCMRHYASLISRDDAEKAILQLKKFNIIGAIVKIV